VFIFSFILILAIIFIGMIVFMRQTFNRSVVSATAHLERMSQEYAKKEDEIKKQFEELKRQAQEILSNARKDAQAQAGQILKEAQEEKMRVINTALGKSDEMLKQADSSCSVLLKEMQNKIEEKALERAARLLQFSLSENTRKQIHGFWIDELISSGLAQLERLRIPENISQAEVSSAFSLTDTQRQHLCAKISEKLGRKITLDEKIGPQLIAGLVVNIGSVVFDGSLRFKIQEAARADSNV
jgi:ATP synthase F1 delta subunit